VFVNRGGSARSDARASMMMDAKPHCGMRDVRRKYSTCDGFPAHPSSCDDPPIARVRDALHANREDVAPWGSSATGGAQRRFDAKR
jgi:hypothetical protein